MKLILSRKGFDSGSGGGPSPILNGIPVSLPIPSGPREPFRYRDLSHPLAGPIEPLVTRASKGRITGAHWAHADPVLPLTPGPGALGQQNTAQAHLNNQGVQAGDVFVFFGLFQAPKGSLPKDHPDLKPHHRIFGMLRTTEKILLGADPNKDDPALARWRTHPHVARGCETDANTLWAGIGCLAQSAHPDLRLTTQDWVSTSTWRVPEWLREKGLSYHAKPERWGTNTLKAAARGQEFVCDIGQDLRALEWINQIETLLGHPA